MSSSSITSGDSIKLPPDLRRLFWDCDFDALDWETHRNFIIGRVLTDGRWCDVRWLREAVGDKSLREWIVSRDGGPLSPQQLRFWELIFHIPKTRVDEWLQQEPRKLWHLKAPKGWLAEPVKCDDLGISLASFADLGAMKLLAVAQRGSRKDFADVFALWQQGLSLAEMLEHYCHKYNVDDVGRVFVCADVFRRRGARPAAGYA